MAFGSEEETSPIPGDISQDAPPNGHCAGVGLIPSSSRFFRLIQYGNGCWPWQGSKNQSGYGLYHYMGKHTTAHRVAWQVFTGDRIPNGLLVLHRCDNPPCVNPEHLFLGTNRDNTLDAIAKGRMKPSHRPYVGWLERIRLARSRGPYRKTRERMSSLKSLQE